MEHACKQRCIQYAHLSFLDIHLKVFVMLYGQRIPVDPLYMGVQESQKNIGKYVTYMTKWECRLSGNADSPKRLHFSCEPELASRVERRQWYSKIYK